MTKIEGQSFATCEATQTSRPHAFGLRASSFIRHSSFVIRHSRRSALLVVFAACVIVIWQGSDRVPTGAATGTQLESPDRAAVRSAHGAASDSVASRRDTLRVATFNIHGGRGTDGVQDLNRIANLLKDFDLVGLNEVHGTRLESRDDQAAQMGKALGQPWLFAPTERRWWRDDFGNGVISSQAVTHWSRMPLPVTQESGYRNIVWLMIPWQGHTVNVLVTHIDRTQDRHVQIRTVLALFQSLAKPSLLLGDFNTPATDPVLRDFLARSDALDVVKSMGSRFAESDRIDWILARGLRRVDSGCVSTTASDHPLVWTELRLDPELPGNTKNSNR